jgi:hypothetical protein
MRTYFILSMLVLAGGTAVAGGLPFAHWGVLDTPDASILQHSQIVLGGSFVAYGYDRPDSTRENDFALAGFVEGGLFGRGQIGVTYLGAGGLSGTARFLALRETVTTPGIAVGCENITGEKDYDFFRDANDSLYSYGRDQNFSAYVVMSKGMDYVVGAPVTVSLGYGIGRFQQRRNDKTDGIRNPFPGLFFSMVFDIGPGGMIAVEWDGRDLNLGGSYSVNRHLTFRGSIAELEQVLRPSDERDPSDVMQSVKFALGAEFTLGPFMNRTTLEPTERLSNTADRAALEALEEARRRAREEIDELEGYMH